MKNYKNPLDSWVWIWVESRIWNEKVNGQVWRQVVRHFGFPTIHNLRQGIKERT